MEKRKDGKTRDTEDKVFELIEIKLSNVKGGVRISWKEKPKQSKDVGPKNAGPKDAGPKDDRAKDVGPKNAGQREIYQVFRTTFAGSWDVIGTTEETEYFDYKVVNRTEYSYAVIAASDVRPRPRQLDLKSSAITYVSDVNLTKIENVRQGVKLTWSRCAGMEKFDVFCRTPGTGWRAVASTEAISTVITTLDGRTTLEEGEHYFFKVRGYTHGRMDGMLHAGIFSNEREIVRVAPPAISSVKIQRGRVIRISWKEKPEVSGYRIQLSQDASFKEKVKGMNVRGEGKCSKTVGPLEGAVYYLRISCYRKVDGKIYSSAWSSARAVRL